MSPDKAASALRGLRKEQARYERAAHLGELEISITPPYQMAVGAGLVQRYADLGVRRLILLATGQIHEHQDELLAFLAAAPQSLLA